MFPIEPGRDYAVITGDVIDSSSLASADRQRLPALIHEVSATLVDWFGDEKLTPISIFGGDSWRVLLASPADALRVGLFIRASLLASGLNIDTRMAIAVGGVDFVPDGDIEQADGEAFRLSGRELGEMANGSTNLGFACADALTSRHWSLVFCLVDALIRTNWTANRARAVSGALRDWPGSRIGELWPTAISKQTVGRHLAEAGWDAVLLAVIEYEGIFSPSAPQR
ncbi:hypothetical protein Pla108_29590 [Botrimarina colliarenosi]|uniref:SatD family (SatD) n=1 Tax=Botrimarina colliarenosi TaxID=2528001 RepID=A0A5C6A7A7_9BACT|nr:hypothetical protein [Botrimarina colliarenosi]TWT95882.1 hypothetical protein Pla108_29590 [Botrimarina colliarenosi]